MYDLKYPVIGGTKKRDKVIKGPIAVRVRERIRQGCEARRIGILQGSVGKRAYSSMDIVYGKPSTE